MAKAWGLLLAITASLALIILVIAVMVVFFFPSATVPATPGMHLDANLEVKSFVGEDGTHCLALIGYHTVALSYDWAKP